MRQDFAAWDRVRRTIRERIAERQADRATGKRTELRPSFDPPLGGQFVSAELGNRNQFILRVAIGIVAPHQCMTLNAVGGVDPPAAIQQLWLAAESVWPSGRPELGNETFGGV